MICTERSHAVVRRVCISRTFIIPAWRPFRTVVSLRVGIFQVHAGRLPIVFIHRGTHGTSLSESTIVLSQLDFDAELIRAKFKGCDLFSRLNLFLFFQKKLNRSFFEPIDLFPV